MEKKIPKESGEISRREFLKDAGLVVGGVAIGSTVLLAACPAPVTETVTETATQTATQTETATATVTEVVSRFVCPSCGGEFEALATLKDHIEAYHPAEVVKTPPAKGELRFDPKLCTSCRKCMLACSLSKEGVCDLGLARLHLDSLDFNPFQIDNVQNICKQCPEPECLSACLFEAISIDANTGARIVIEENCTGCGLCVDPCQFGMIKMNPEKTKVFKCDLCSGSPLCVEVCPTGALTYVEVQG